MTVARHTIYNLAGSLVPIAVLIVTVPLYLRVVGLDRYGVLSVCWLLLGYFNLFDLGLGRAMAQRLASLPLADDAVRNRIFWTAMTISAGLSVMAMAVFVPVAGYGLAQLKFESADLYAEIGDALPLLAIALPIGIVQSGLIGALEGRRAFLHINLIISLGTVATTSLPLLAAYLVGPQLSNLLLVSVCARLGTVLLLIFASARVVPVGAPTRPARRELKGLLAFGGWATVSSVIGPLLVFWDRFVIGAMISAAAVAVYVVPFNLISQVQVLPNALTGALFPRLAEVAAAHAKALTEEATAILLTIVTPITLAALLLTEPFMDLWLGAEVSGVAAPIAFILLSGFWANSLARIPAAELLARGRPRLLALAHVCELVPYAGVLFVAIWLWGVEGAALTWSLRCMADAIILGALAGGLKRQLSPIMSHAAIVVSATACAYLLPASAPLRWAAFAALTAAAGVLIAKDFPPRLVKVVSQFRQMPFRPKDKH